MDSFRRSTPKKVPQGLRAWNNIIFHADDERKPSCNALIAQPCLFQSPSSFPQWGHLIKQAICPLFPLPHFHWLYIPLASSPTTHTVCKLDTWEEAFPPCNHRKNFDKQTYWEESLQHLRKLQHKARYLNSTALSFLCHKILQHSFKNLCLGQHMG